MLVVLMPMLVALTPRVPLRCTIMCAEQPPKASRTTTSSAPNVKSAAKELKSRLEADRERKLHNLFSQPPPTLDAGDDAVSGSHLMERDQLIGVIDSHALLDADEAAGLWPLMLDRDDEARQLAYVDESECIGCTYCASIARSAFHMHEDAGGASRVVQQGEEPDATSEAIDACPTNCIHMVSRGELRHLEARRSEGHHDYLPHFRDGVHATTARMAVPDAGPSFPGIEQQRRAVEEQRERERKSGGAGIAIDF